MVWTHPHCSYGDVAVYIIIHSQGEATLLDYGCHSECLIYAKFQKKQSSSIIPHSMVDSVFRCPLSTKCLRSIRFGLKPALLDAYSSIWISLCSQWVCPWCGRWRKGSWDRPQNGSEGSSKSKNPHTTILAVLLCLSLLILLIYHDGPEPAYRCVRAHA